VIPAEFLVVGLPQVEHRSCVLLPGVDVVLVDWPMPRLVFLNSVRLPGLPSEFETLHALYSVVFVLQYDYAPFLYTAQWPPLPASSVSCLLSETLGIVPLKSTASASD